MTYIIQNKEGQSSLSSSISAGLDYVGVGPEHAFLKASGRAKYGAVTDTQALEGFDMLCKYVRAPPNPFSSPPSPSSRARAGSRASSPRSRRPTPSTTPCRSPRP
jgi:hypothetical protein